MAKAEFNKLKGEYFVDDLEAFEKGIRKSGWSKLGAGVYSVAYGKGKLVWKVSRDKTSIYVDATFLYLRAVMKGELRSEFAPHVFRLVRGRTGGYACLMDRLDKAAHECPKLVKRYGRLENIICQEASQWRKEWNIPFLTYCKHVRDTFPRLACDMHPGNYRVRYRTTLVLTDPFMGNVDPDREHEYRRPRHR